MTVTSPSKTEPDSELLDALAGRGRDTLYTLFEALHDSNERGYEIGAFTTEEWRHVIVHEYPTGTQKFIDAYEKLRKEGVRKAPVVEHLAQHYDIDSEKLDVDRLPELVAVLLDKGLLDQLDEIVIAAKFRPSAVTGTYTLDQEIPLEGLEEKIDDFHKSWNKGVEGNGVKKSKRLDIEYNAEKIVTLRFYRESSETTARYFGFRKDGDDPRPKKPEIQNFHYRQLKHTRFLISNQDGETRLVFTKSLSGWKQSLRTVFSQVFGVDDVFSKMSKPSSEIAQDVEEAAGGDVDENVDPIAQTQSYIDTRCETAKDEIEDLGIPPQDKEVLKNHLDSVSITGTDVEEDQSIATRELRIISQTSLAEMFASVDIEDGFRDLLRKANEENLAFVLDVNGVPVECSNGSWSRAGPGQLPDSVRQAMQVFFNEDAPI